MSWIRKWFAQGNEIAHLRMEVEFLTRERNEYQSLLDREETRTALLESALGKEVADHKRTLRRIADQAAKQLGLPAHYVKDGEEARSVPSTPPDPEESSDEQFVRWQAEAQRNADIEAGITPNTIEFYEAIIRSNPNGFIIG